MSICYRLTTKASSSILGLMCTFIFICSRNYSKLLIYMCAFFGFSIVALQTFTLFHSFSHLAIQYNLSDFHNCIAVQVNCTVNSHKKQTRLCRSFKDFRSLSNIISLSGIIFSSFQMFYRTNKFIKNQLQLIDFFLHKFTCISSTYYDK